MFCTCVKAFALMTHSYILRIHHDINGHFPCTKPTILYHIRQLHTHTHYNYSASKPQGHFLKLSTGIQDTKVIKFTSHKLANKATHNCSFRALAV